MRFNQSLSIIFNNSCEVKHIVLLMRSKCQSPVVCAIVHNTNANNFEYIPPNAMANFFRGWQRVQNSIPLAPEQKTEV